MKTERLILYEYGEVLMHKRKNFEVCFDGTIEEQRRTAGVIWRYAITHLLGWTPEQALIYLDQKTIKMLKLDLTYCRLRYEYSTKKFFDLRFILQYAFPEKIHYDIREDARNEFERVCKLGKWEGETEKYRFHKNYFSGEDGRIRAAEVLNYAISLFLSDMDSFELYKFFGDKKKATAWLAKHEIDSNIKSLYPTPLDYLHYSLPEEQQNVIYYLNEYLRTNYLS